MVRNIKSLTRAVELLEEYAGRSIGNFSLCLERWADDQSEVTRRNESLSFRRFVEALGRGDVAIQEIEFVLTDWDGFPEDDMERLFGQVLPSHPTLRSIGIFRRTIPTRFVRLLTSSVLAAANSTTQLTKLCFMAVPIQHEDVQAIADMVDRQVALSELTVSPYVRDHALDAADGRLICDAVARNGNLRVLKIHVTEILDDALDRVASSLSSLRELEVRGTFSELSVSNLATQLRTNAKLTRLTLEHIKYVHPSKISPALFRPLEDALEASNFSLVHLELTYIVLGLDGPPFAEAQEAELDRLVRRNRRIQRVLDQLEPRTYHVSPISLWPSVLEVVSPLPTLVYRYLRKGDVNKLCDLLRPKANV